MPLVLPVEPVVLSDDIEPLLVLLLPVPIDELEPVPVPDDDVEPVPLEPVPIDELPVLPDDVEPVPDDVVPLSELVPVPVPEVDPEVEPVPLVVPLVVPLLVPLPVAPVDELPEVEPDGLVVALSLGGLPRAAGSLGLVGLAPVELEPDEPEVWAIARPPARARHATATAARIGFLLMCISW